MKAIRIITHPYTIMISFFLIMISGQHWGGFYLLYVLIALPHAGIHALLALFGIALLAFTYSKYERKRIYHIESILNIIGILALIFSLFFFFYNDKQNYNEGTFYQLIPQITLIAFSILALAFIVDNIMPFFKSPASTSGNQRFTNS